jgi:predicted TIM-barrel fold metal-dependent hydrolase
MIVDAHTHIYEHPLPKDKRPASAADLLREMDAAGVAMALVLPLPGRASNEFVYHECAKHPDRLAALYVPEFDEPSETFVKLRNFLEDHDCRGIKIHPRLQRVTVEDAVVHEITAWASERRLPLLFDCFPSGSDLDNPRFGPLAYHRLAQEIPTAQIVLAHAGGYKVLEAFMTAKANPNIILESSFTLGYFPGTSVERDLAFAFGHLYPGRTMYGSDFPEMPVADHLQRTRRVLESMSPDRAAAFYGQTAAQLYRLKV